MYQSVLLEIFVVLDDYSGLLQFLKGVLVLDSEKTPTPNNISVLWDLLFGDSFEESVFQQLLQLFLDFRDEPLVEVTWVARLKDNDEINATEVRLCPAWL